MKEAAIFINENIDKSIASEKNKNDLVTTLH